jgi:hypothetical protein
MYEISKHIREIRWLDYKRRPVHTSYFYTIHDYAYHPAGIFSARVEATLGPDIGDFEVAWMQVIMRAGCAFFETDRLGADPFWKYRKVPPVCDGNSLTMSVRIAGSHREPI